jgi:hypothetical protein
LNTGRWLERTFFSEKKLHQENCYVLKWLEVKADFLRYLESIDYDERTTKKIVSFLDKYVVEVREPFDIIDLFSKVKRSRRHLVLGLRKLFSFYEALGCDKAYLDSR